MNDRLPELKGGRNEQPIDTTKDVELGNVEERNITGVFMKEVFDRVDAVKVRFLVTLRGETHRAE